MPQLTFTKFPKKQQGELILVDVTGFVVGATVTGGTSGATGKIIKVKTASNTLILNTLTGIFADGETVTAGAGTDTVATNGFNISVTAQGVVRTKRVGSRVLSEVLTAISGFVSKRIDARNMPTFTAARAYSGTAAMVTGDTLTVTLTATEGVSVKADAYITLMVGANTRKLTYASSASDTSHAFTYTVVADDEATATQVVIGTEVVGTVLDLGVNSSVAATFTAPNVTAATVN